MAMTVVCVWCDRTKRNLPSYSKKPWNIVQFILCCHSLWLSKNEDDATAFVPKCVSASNPTNRTQFPEMTFPKSGSGWLSLVVRQMTNGNVCVNLIQQTEGNFLSITESLLGMINRKANKVNRKKKKLTKKVINK